MKIDKFKSEVGEYILNVEPIEIEKGEVTLIYGPSGSGKTSFLQGLIGINKADFDLNIEGLSVSQILPRERKFSVVFQFNNLFDHLKVLKNIELIRDDNIDEREFLTKINGFGIDSLLDKKAAVLSGGEKQIVSCVRAFLHKGRNLILMDEPWGSMDFENKNKFRTELLKYLKLEKIPCVLISHDKDEEISSLNPKFMYDFTQIARFEYGHPR